MKQTPLSTEIHETFAEQVIRVAKKCRQNRRELVAELLESDRIIRHDTRQILDLGIKVNKYEAALREIIESEKDQAIQSYGLGDIARKALE